MKKHLYVFKSGSLHRKDNTLYLKGEDFKRALPITSISDIHVFGEITLNKRVLEFLSSNRVSVHFFNRYGYYVGTYYPREYYNSGLVILKQAEHYLNSERRLYLAKAFVKGSIYNMSVNLRAYSLEDDYLKDLLQQVDDRDSIESLMALEGNARDFYYSRLEDIISSDEFKLGKRVRRPPSNPMNALISFGNSLLYVAVLSEIYRTHLDPRIGYLHQTNQRSFSLNLDIAEVFKPVIVDRVIFSLVNRRKIRKEHFMEEIGGVFLTQEGMKIFVEEFESKLSASVKYRHLGKVSYRRLIRMECYKLYKHFFGEEDYKPFVSRR